MGGEAWSDTGIKALRQAADVDLLVNAYGPTETVIAPTAWIVDDAALTPGQPAPIGRPVGVRSAYILDADLNIVPVGVTGELFIGGLGLARGYLKRGALTAERFVPDPFGGNGDRLYRTGDLARWRADGVIEYVGRADQQVKIRGFRIELGEIEARLLEQRGVRAAAVVAREGRTGRQLIAYASGEPALDGRALRDALSAMLPDYMVPSTIMVLEQLPLTPNGKIDRRALPSPHEDARPAAAMRRLRTKSRSRWRRSGPNCSVSARVGRNDHFFELGGHSLLAVRVLSRVSQEIGVSMPVSDLFVHSELASFARVVSIRLIEQEFDAEELQESDRGGAVNMVGSSKPNLRDLDPAEVRKLLLAGQRPWSKCQQEWTRLDSGGAARWATGIVLCATAALAAGAARWRQFQLSHSRRIASHGRSRRRRMAS